MGSLEHRKSSGVHNRSDKPRPTYPELDSSQQAHLPEDVLALIKQIELLDEKVGAKQKPVKEEPHLDNLFGNIGTQDTSFDQLSAPDIRTRRISDRLDRELLDIEYLPSDAGERAIVLGNKWGSFKNLLGDANEPPGPAETEIRAECLVAVSTALGSEINLGQLELCTDVIRQRLGRPAVGLKDFGEYGISGFPVGYFLFTSDPARNITKRLLEPERVRLAQDFDLSPSSDEFPEKFALELINSWGLVVIASNKLTPLSGQLLETAKSTILEFFKPPFEAKRGQYYDLVKLGFLLAHSVENSELLVHKARQEAAEPQTSLRATYSAARRLLLSSLDLWKNNTPCEFQPVSTGSKIRGLAINRSLVLRLESDRSLSCLLVEPGAAHQRVNYPLSDATKGILLLLEQVALKPGQIVTSSGLVLLGDVATEAQRKFESSIESSALTFENIPGRCLGRGQK